MFVAILPFLLTSCGNKKQASIHPPPPPAIAESEAKPVPPVPRPQPQKTPAVAEEAPEPIYVPPDAKPISVETGLASWYGAPYNNRRGSNGKIYDMNAMTAAHRTLPLGTIVRVTNVMTGHSALVRITDRGPFVSKRILDLSLAAAKKIDVWQPGVAMVRVEVLETPTAIDSGGRWAVQIGAFAQEDSARDLADKLTRRYHSAKILSFSSPVGDWWVRVRVPGDDHNRAAEVVRNTQTSEGSIFLVRLD